MIGRGCQGLVTLALWLTVVSPVWADDAASTGSNGDALEQRVVRGPVELRLEIRPERPVLGDVVELEIGVVAEPEVEVLMPEFGEALGRFEIVDFAPRERVDDQGRTLATQTYRLQPMRSGRQSIPPLRVEFVDRREGQRPAPEGEDAFEVMTDRVALEIAPILAEDAPLVLRPAHGDLGPRRGPGPPAWVWLVALLAVLLVGAPLGWRAWMSYRLRDRQRSAYEVARAEFDALLAEGLPDAARMDDFYVRLSLVVRSYLEDRFGLRSPELTTPEFLTEMGRSPDLARSHQQLLRDFLTQADLVKFAGHRPEREAVSESIASAERFLEETRHQVSTGQESGGQATGVGHA